MTVSVAHTILNTVSHDSERLALNRIFDAQPHLKDEEVNSVYELTLQHISRKMSFDDFKSKISKLSVLV